MNASPIVRQPHAVLDLNSRVLKARKIEILLGLKKQEAKLRLLEIGAGSAGISHYFSTESDQQFDVDAIDVVDNRLVFDGYKFQLVHGVNLPFENEEFDVVITNHVIEHVGDIDAQHLHLNEIRRVLKKNGVGYLAVPNRWMLVEPHYRLIFLSWLPRRFRSLYLKYFRGVDFYDCEPLELNELELMFAMFDFDYKNRCIEALRLTFFLERPNSWMGKLIELLPDTIFKPFKALIPTLIYTFKK